MTDGAALVADEVLPAKPIRQWVLSLPLALRFLLATDPAALTQVLGIVYRTISAYVLKRARFTRATGATSAVTLIQRFGSALNLNIHFHMLVLDGAYLVGTDSLVFRRMEAPSRSDLQALVERVAECIGRALVERSSGRIATLDVAVQCQDPSVTHMFRSVGLYSPLGYTARRQPRPGTCGERKVFASPSRERKRRR